MARACPRAVVGVENIFAVPGVAPEHPSGLPEHVVLGAPNPRGSASVVMDPRHCLGTREVNAVGSLVQAHGGAPVVERVPERAAYGIVVRAVKIDMRHRLDCVGSTCSIGKWAQLMLCIIVD
jgi:hypothetical protein